MDIGNQLSNYGKQMRELLSIAKADVQTYKFSIEKTDHGFDLDCVIKVSFNTKDSNNPRGTGEENIESLK